jgi:hypothetical protein
VAARFADEGGVAGCKPVPATAFGVTCVEGREGAEGVAVRATAEDSSGGELRFQKAQLGPDWHPVRLAIAQATTTAETQVRFIALASLTRN